MAADVHRDDAVSLEPAGELAKAPAVPGDAVDADDGRARGVSPLPGVKDGQAQRSPDQGSSAETSTAVYPPSPWAGASTTCRCAGSSESL